MLLNGVFQIGLDIVLMATVAVVKAIETTFLLFKICNFSCLFSADKCIMSGQSV